MPRFLATLLAALVALPILVRPGDLPREWHLWTPLILDKDTGFVARWKLRAIAASPLCHHVLGRSKARVLPMPDAVVDDRCHIKTRVRLTGLSRAMMTPVDTRCEIAARLYLWEVNALQPAARRILGTEVSQILHYSSYSCRQIRTDRGVLSRMSQHATANAVDISGVRLADGRTLSVLDHWPKNSAEGRFVRAARDGLCDWFNLVLSPDYNALHADHFHVDMGPFSRCR